MIFSFLGVSFVDGKDHDKIIGSEVVTSNLYLFIFEQMITMKKIKYPIIHIIKTYEL